MTQANPIRRAINTFMDQHVPREAHMPIYACLIPLTIQVCCRVMRQKICQQIEKTDDHSVVKQSFNLRNKIIVVFLSLEVVQTVAFLKFSFSNRWFLIPAFYTLGHFAWTAYSYKQESQIEYKIYKSMDGDVDYRQVP